MTGIDTGEVERLADALTTARILTDQHCHKAAALLRRLAAENAALREKLEAAETERAGWLGTLDAQNNVLDGLMAELAEARACQAAAWEAGLSQQMPHDFIGVWHFVTEWCAKNDETVEAQTAWGEVVQFLRSTPPADLSTALQAVKDAELERAAAVADEEAKRHLWDARHAGHGQQERAKASACWSAADMVAQRIRALRRAAPTGGEG